MFTTLFLALSLWTCYQPETEGPVVETDVLSSPTFATQMLEEVNALRAGGCRCGSRLMPPAPPLRWNDQLEKAARRHARDMNNNTFFSHTGSDGSSASRRVREAGYTWRAVAENIAWGHPDIPAVVKGWKESRGHCENMMSKDYTEMGAAQEGVYWVQDLGRQ